MPIYLIVKTYWKPITLLLVIIFSLVAIKWYGASQYNKGVSSATATLQHKLDDVITKQAAQMAQASNKYQALKTLRETEQDVQYVEIEKIIREPVYLNVCIDDDGLSAINSAASGQ